MEEAVLNPTQFLIQKLTQVDRLFRDLALNPASLALQNYLMAGQTRLSSVNCFVKWQGDFGYGPQLGLHADQGATPTSWGPVAHTANSTWCLTDYTLDGGALAYIPGSHREGKPVPPPERVKDAIPAEAPKGSVVVWHGATWHGAFPRKDKGLRLGLAVYHRHAATLPQEDVPGHHRGDGAGLRQSGRLSRHRRVERQVPVPGDTKRGHPARAAGVDCRGRLRGPRPARLPVSYPTAKRDPSSVPGTWPVS